MKEIDSVQTSYSPNTRTFLSLEEPKKKIEQVFEPSHEQHHARVATSSESSLSLPKYNRKRTRSQTGRTGCEKGLLDSSFGRPFMDFFET